MKKAILLLSGGLDSVTLLYHLKQLGIVVLCVLFDYGQAHVQELQFAITHCKRMGVLWKTITLPPLGGLNAESWIVPFRNPIMLSIAVNIAVQEGSDSVVIGCNADDEKDFPDCRWAVLDAINHAIKLSGYSVQIEAPFLHLKKWEIGAWAQEMGIPMHEIWTCYRGGVKPCGKCPACDKLQAVRERLA